MNTDHRFILELETLLKGDLPGLGAQMKMAPIPAAMPFDLLPKRDPIRSAVLICLFPGNNSWGFILTKRSHQVEYHRGQISLPGGAWEDGETLQQTALRETREEIGLNIDDISIIGQLTPLFISVSGYEVQPFVGWIDKKPLVDPDPAEVMEVYKISIEELQAEKNLRKIKRTIRGVDRDIPLFDFNGIEVWGATAMILSEFREIVFGISHKVYREC